MSSREFFRGIIGQDEAVDVLSRSLRSRQIQTAYLFRGPEGVGRLTTALCFASALLNTTPERVLDSPYLLLIGRTGASVGINTVRDELLPFFSLRVAESWRVAIVEDAELMTPEAQNALLKTLEEPPPRCCIILIISRPTLLPTVLSRCAVVNFKRLKDEDVLRILLEEGEEEKDARAAAELSSGSVKTARFLLEKGLTEVTRRVVQTVVDGGDVFEVLDGVTGGLKREEVVRYSDILIPLIAKRCKDPERRQHLVERLVDMKRLIEQSANIRLALVAFASAVGDVG